MTAGGAFLAALLLSAAAADEPICADRPGAANPSCTVPAGMVQVETGLAAWSRDRSGGVRTDELTVVETAVKFGLTDRLHVELGLPAFVRSRSSDAGTSETESGLGDSAVAAKWRFTADSSAVQAAIYPFVKLPTAKRTLGNGKVEGGVALLVDGPVGESAFSWNIAPEVDVVADGDGSGHHPAIVQVVSIGAAVSDRLSVAADLLGSWDFDPAGTVRQYVAGLSAAYLLSNSVQVDAGIDFGLNRDAPDVALYSGIAFRF